MSTGGGLSTECFCVAGVCVARGMLERLDVVEDSVLSPVVFKPGVRVVCVGAGGRDRVLLVVGANDSDVGSSLYLSGKEATGRTTLGVGVAGAVPTHGWEFATPQVSMSSWILATTERG